MTTGLLFCDGFDHYNSELIPQKWDYSYGLVTQPQIGAGGRSGSNCLLLSNYYTRVGKHIPFKEQICVGMAYHPGNGQVLEQRAFAFFFDEKLLCELLVSETGRLYVKAGNYNGLNWNYEEVGTSNNVYVRSGVFNYLEMYVLCDANNGEIIVRLEENPVIVVTGVDTAYRYDSGNDANNLAQGIGHVRVGGSPGWPDEFWNGALRVDDFYIREATSNNGNDFLGDISIEEHVPTGDGFYQMFVPNIGNNHFELVDDGANNVDGITTCVASKNVEAVDTYTFPALTANNGTILAVGVTLYTEKTNAGSRNLCGVAYGESTLADGNEFAVLQDFAFFQSFVPNAPGGGNWTVENINNAEFGQKVTL